MRILLACYFELSHYGGLSRYVNTLKKQLEANGHYVDILSHHQGMKTIYKFTYIPDQFGWTITGREFDKSTTNNEELTIKGVIDSQVFEYYQKNLPDVDPHISWREIERYTFEVAAALLDLNSYDLIHTHDILSTRALWRVKPKHIPLIATIHGILATEYTNSGHISSKESLMWRYAVAEEYYGHMSTNATIVPTNWQKRELSTHYGVPMEKMKVIPYGMDLYPFLEQFKYDPYPPLTEKQRKPGKFVIACPARLVPEKDHKTLINALSILKAKRNDFVCWLIGDGHLSYEVEIQAKNLGVSDNVVFFGARWDIPSMLKVADIVVLPSIQDMYPYALMEAQVAGKACVASDAGGIPEVVRDEETGLIFETGNSIQLAEKFAQLMDNPTLRSRLAENAMNSGRVRYSSNTLFNNTMKVYRNALNGGESATQYDVAEPELVGQYGLIHTRKREDDNVHNIFKFALDGPKLDIPKWRTVLNAVPENYSIPDTSFVHVLAGQLH